MLSMESTSTRMNRLGKSLITDSELLSLDRIVAEIDAVEAEAVCELAAVLLAPERLSAAGIGPSEERFLDGARARGAGARARRMRVLLNGAAAARSAPRSGRGSRRRATSSSGRWTRPTRWSTSRRRTRRRQHAARRSKPACPASSARRGWDRRGGRGRARGRLAVFYAPNFAIGAVLMMRFAAEAAAAPAARRDRRAAPRDQAGRAVRHGEGDRGAMPGDVPIHSVRLPGLVAHQEVHPRRRGPDADDPPRHDLARGVRARRAARAGAAADAAGGLDRRPRRAVLVCPHDLRQLRSRESSRAKFCAGMRLRAAARLPVVRDGRASAGRPLLRRMWLRAHDCARRRPRHREAPGSPSAGSCLCCSPTWSASRRCPSRAIPRMSVSCCRSYFEIRAAHRAVRRRGREVHRRCGHGRLGGSGGQEDDAERAVRAALDLMAAVSALGDEVGTPELRARAGVLTGEAAVNLGARQGMVAGDLVNSAARIQAAAEPGTVLVGEATRRASERRSRSTTQASTR